MLAARASYSLNDYQTASEYAARAQAVLSRLKTDWGETDYNSYLSRPDHQPAMGHLKRILALPE